MPKFEAEADIGIAWLFQGKACLNFNDNIFCKIRYSETFLAQEYGFSVGYQKILSNKTKAQAGVGYSRLTIHPFVPGGPNEDDTISHWHGVIMDFGFIHYFTPGIIRIGVNAGVNFVVWQNRAVPSLNIGFAFGMF